MVKNKECFIDIHCHLDSCKNIPEVINKSIKSNVMVILSQGTNPESNRKVLELSKKYKEAKAALGLYPIDALSLTDGEIEKEIDFIKSHRKEVAAIGEVGMDFKEDEKQHERQKIIFEKFTKLSKELDKPIIVHSRKAELECIELLEKLEAKKVIMHCFCGKFSLAERIVKNGWYLSIPASIKNSQQFQNIVEKITLTNLFCETDSPYLHPDKKWPNEPSNVLVSYEKIAEIKKVSLNEVKKQIFSNYSRIFT